MSVEAASWPGTSDPNVAPPIKKRKGEQRPYIVAITPAAILLSAFFIFPALWVIYTSTTSLSLTNFSAGAQFVGLDNYRRLWHNPDFPKFVKNTIIFTIGAAMIGQTIGGLLIALLIHHAQIHKHKLAPVAFTAVLLGWICPPTLAGFIWGGIFDYRNGMLNTALQFLHLGRVDMLGNFPMFSVILVESWRGLAFALIIFLGALQSIPQQVYEAASIDGATPWMRFKDQTLPAMRHVIALVLLVTTITTIGSFLMILILTNGDPAYATETIALHAYHQAFTLFDIGYGAALSVVMLLMSFVFAVVYLRIAKGSGDLE
jgi:multiple sugar transport system permease protein